jgi:hypothetical protein
MTTRSSTSPCETGLGMALSAAGSAPRNPVGGPWAGGIGHGGLVDGNRSIRSGFVFKVHHAW